MPKLRRMPADFQLKRRGFRSPQRSLEQSSRTADLVQSYALSLQAGKAVAPIIKAMGLALDYETGRGVRIENNKAVFITDSAAQLSRLRNLSKRLLGKLVADGVSSDDFRSFPSGHTACAACSMLLILLPTLYRRLHDKEKLFMVLGGVWTLAVAVSRLRMGMHFLSDVSVSSLLTIALGAVAVWLFYFNKPFFNKIWAFASGDPKPAKKPRTPEEP